MLPAEKIFTQIYENIDAVIAQEDKQGTELFRLLILQHPADIADFLQRFRIKKQLLIFTKLPEKIVSKVFEKLPENLQVSYLAKLDIDKVTTLLKNIHSDKLADLFDHLTDSDLKKYLKLLQKKQRHLIIAQLNFEPDSAGRIVNSDVLTLEHGFTVKRSIQLLQRLTPKTDILRRIYITDHSNKLLGYIRLDELVLNKPDTPLKQIMHKNIVTINAHQDQEKVAKTMHHYSLFSAPVVDQSNNFLGVITADEIFDILEEEASEDVYKMSGLTPVEYSYFQTPASTLIRQRFSWLASLLLLQSASSFIVESYQEVIKQNVIISFFITMLIGTGGNAGNQSATLVIRGLATGEIKLKDGLKTLLRELGISVVLASLLVVVSFARIYFIHRDFISAIAISLSLFFIVITSMGLGTLLPLILERLGIDPAHSAAPFLATIMDILGMLIYCIICSRMLG